MLRLFYSLTLLAFLNACSNEKEQTFTVAGKITDSQFPKIYLEEIYFIGQQAQVMDSAVIGSDGKFLLRAKTSTEGLFNLRVGEANHLISLINDVSKIKVEINESQNLYKISGSSASQAIKDFIEQSEVRVSAIIAALQYADSLKKVGNTTSKLDSINTVTNNLLQEYNKYSRGLITHSKNGTFCLFALSTYQNTARNPVLLIEAFSSEEIHIILTELAGRFPENSAIVTIKNSFDAGMNKTGWVGKTAPEISLADTEGVQRKLSDFKGKYVLVDFWASWCGPCRNENPTIVKAYNKFRNKNFTVLGVSLDSDLEAWKRAIVKDKLNWTHISDLKKWDSEMVSLYRIDGIPFNVLVNPNGKVIAENLRGEELEVALEKFLK